MRPVSQPEIDSRACCIRLVVVNLQYRPARLQGRYRHQSYQIITFSYGSRVSWLCGYRSIYSSASGE